jgi:hypothetical protein
MATFLTLKDPDATGSWTIDWSDWLNGDTISVSTWSVTANESPIALSVTSSSIAADTSVSPNVSSQWATVVVTGGTEGVVYTLTNEVTDNNGYKDNNSISVRVIQK